MIFEQRTYTLHPGKLEEYWKAYREGGVDLMAPMMPHLVGYFVSEVGPLNQVVILFRFNDFSERMAKLAEMNAIEGWQAHLATVRKLISHQENKLLMAAPVEGLAPIVDLMGEC